MMERFYAVSAVRGMFKSHPVVPGFILEIGMCKYKNTEQVQEEQDIEMGGSDHRLVDLSGLTEMQAVMSHPDDFNWLDWERMAL